MFVDGSLRNVDGNNIFGSYGLVGFVLADLGCKFS